MWIRAEYPKPALQSSGILQMMLFILKYLPSLAVYMYRIGQLVAHLFSHRLTSKYLQSRY